MIKGYSFLFILMLMGFCSFGDSPITSTPFWEAYNKEEIVIQAKNTGKLDEKLSKFLASPKNNIDLKVAVINCISWNNKDENSEFFLEYLIKKKKYKNLEDFKAKGEADHLLCMAYLMAMDDYFEVTDALNLADLALSKNKTSFTFAIIKALIEAQSLFSDDWCKVYNTTNNVRNNPRLIRDLNAESISIIFEYMNLYKSYC